MTGLVSGTRNRGRPRTCWIDNIVAWTDQSGANLLRIARDRGRWSALTQPRSQPSQSDYGEVTWHDMTWCDAAWACQFLNQGLRGGRDDVMSVGCLNGLSIAELSETWKNRRVGTAKRLHKFRKDGSMLWVLVLNLKNKFIHQTKIYKKKFCSKQHVSTPCQ